MAEPGKDIINNGVVVIKDDILIGVGDQTLLKRYNAPVMIDADENLVMPGLINAHNRVPMIAFRSIHSKNNGKHIYNRI